METTASFFTSLYSLYSVFPSPGLTCRFLSTSLAWNTGSLQKLLWQFASHYFTSNLSSEPSWLVEFTSHITALGLALDYPHRVLYLHPAGRCSVKNCLTGVRYTVRKQRLSAICRGLAFVRYRWSPPRARTQHAGGREDARQTETACVSPTVSSN
jgi:hypothetical protein